MQNRSVSILYLPHGSTYDNENGVSTGTADVVLSPLGEQQVIMLHDYMKSQTVDAVFCSELKRAIDTANGIFGDRYKLKKDKRLNEIDVGELTGRSTDLTIRIWKQYISKKWPGGESYKDIEAKMRSFLNYLISDYAGKKVVVIGHQATQLALEVLLNGLSWEEAIDNDWRESHAFQNGWDYTAGPERL